MSAPFFESRPDRMPLGRLVAWAGGAVQGHFRRVVGRLGMTGTEVGVLGALAHAGVPLSQRELAGRVGLTPATLTPALDALERAGHIHRRRDGADRRVVRVSATEGGRAQLRSVAGDVASAFGERMPHPPPEHEQIIREYLVAVLVAVDDDTRCAGGAGSGARYGEGE